MDCLRDKLRARDLSARSADTYLREIRRAEEFMTARSTTLRRASGADVTAYVATRPRTWASIKLTRNALAHYWAIVRRRQAPLWAVPKMVRPQWHCRALEELDARRLESAARARGDALGLVVLLGLYLGLRREEMASFRWDCLTDGWASIVGKGGRTRWVFLHPVLVEELRRAQAVTSSPWVFPGRVNGHVHPATIWDWTRIVAASVGLDVAPHELRHTCLATAHDATGDLRATQTMAGHARPETTALYTRTTRRRMKQLVLSIDYETPSA